MKNLFSIVTACMLLFNVASAQNITIPDANFKTALVSTNCVDTNGDEQSDADADTNNDGEISVAEALAVTWLNVGSRSIAFLDGIQYFTNLQYLYCHYNQLTILNVQGLTNLQTLVCSYNQLTTLNVQGCTNLQDLGCAYNQLTTLNVQGLINLQGLDCSSNLLTTLNVQGLANLHLLYCYDNQLTTLNVQGLTNLQALDCSNNQFTSLFIKNGRNEYITFPNNPNLAYICCDESELTDIQNAATASGLTNCTINSYCSFTPGGVFYTIQGENKLDANNNGCDSNDASFPNMKYNIRNGSINGGTISNTSGYYNIPVQAGTHRLKPLFENPTYYTASPDSIQITFPNTTSDTLTQNFCVTPNGTHHDVEVTIIPITPARPGFDATYQIVYKNKGTVVESDSLRFSFDDARIDFISASVAPSNQRRDTLAWYYTNLQPFETRTINLTMNINSPMETPPVNAGDVLSLQATVFPFPSDEMPSDNRFNVRQVVVGSLDPNDKTCLEGDKITPDMIGQYLHYVIRFENTGTYYAENVVVKDVIDATKFDIASLQMTKASHNCRTNINGNKVEFIFENINLPFTEPDKHGYVAFKIKTKPTIALGDAVTNKADIFFDYNFPITTNTATTQVVASLNPSEGGKPNSIVFDITPNPVTDILNLKTDILIEKCEIYDNLGRKVIEVANYPTVGINVALMPKGSYFIKVFGGNGSAVARFVKL